jgi:hypothetical protein
MGVFDKHPVLRVTFLYLLFAGLWILLSDSLVRWYFPEPDYYLLAQSLKGLAFVLGTTLLLYLILVNEWRRRIASEEALRLSEARLERAEQASLS